MRRYALVLFVVACGGGTRPPDGALGVRWGDDGAAAATRLGLACATWEPWPSLGSFETCFGKAQVWDRDAAVTLVRDGAGVDGLLVEWPCMAEEHRDIAARVRSEYRLGTSADDPFTQWSSGELVKLEHADQTCRLVVGGRRFGNAYVANGVASALGGVLTGPH